MAIDEQHLAETRDVKTTTGRRVFVGGCERSGTTLTASLIADAAGIVFLPESPFLLEALEAGSCKIGKGGIFQRKHMLDNWRVDLWGEEFLKRRNELPRDGLPVSVFESMTQLYAEVTGQPESYERGWLEHTPHNIQRIRLLQQQFSDPVFIHVIRDPRAVVSSLLRVDFGPTSALGAAELWKSNVLDGVLAEHSFPNRVCRVMYEDVVTSPEATIRNACQQLNLQVAPGWAPKGRKIDLKMQQHELLLQKKPEASRLMAWKKELSAKQIADVEYIAGSALGLLGYELSTDLTTKSTATRRTLVRAADGMNQLLWQLPKRMLSRVLAKVR